MISLLSIAPRVRLPSHSWCQGTSARAYAITFSAFTWVGIANAAPSTSLPEIAPEALPSALRATAIAYQSGDPERCVTAAQETIAAATATESEAGLSEARRDDADRTPLSRLARSGLEQAHLLAGLCEAARGDTTAALREAEAALRLRPGLSDAQVLRARALVALNQPDAAAKAFEEVLWFNRTSLFGAPGVTAPRISVELAALYRQLGRTEEAQQLLQTAASQSADPAVLSALIESLLAVQNRPEALRLARQAIGSHPQITLFSTLLAEALLLNIDASLGSADCKEARSLVADRAARAERFDRDVAIAVRALSALQEFSAAEALLRRLRKGSANDPAYQAAVRQLAIEKQAGETPAVTSAEAS